MTSGKNLDYELIFSPRAIKQLREIDRRTQERIKKAVQGLKTVPPVGDIKKLKGLTGRYRLRVGNFRVIFLIDTYMRKVYISEILPRKEAYK
jgi:mRNA interferase RelE/StbE